MLKRVASLFRPRLKEKVVPAVSLEPHRDELEFALVLVEVNSDQQTERTVGSVSDDAVEFQGVVLQIVGSVTFIAFTGVAGCRGPSRRHEFVSHIIQKHRILVRVLHGKRSALVGNMGGIYRQSYTAVPDNLKELLGQLSSLKPGEVAEA